MENLKSLDYQFTAVPTQLMILLDVNCRSMLFTLCQLSSYYADENGRFFRTNADLSEESRLSQKLVIATIDTLYSHGIINVWSVGKSNGKHSNYFRLNVDRFNYFERLSMDELKNPEFQIEMVNYREKATHQVIWRAKMLLSSHHQLQTLHPSPFKTRLFLFPNAQHLQSQKLSQYLPKIPTI